MAQLRFFASKGPSLWNRLPLQSVPPSTLAVYPYLSLTSKPVLSLAAKRTGSASERLMLREELYKWTNTRQYNTIINKWHGLETQYLFIKYLLRLIRFILFKIIERTTCLLGGRGPKPKNRGPCTGNEVLLLIFASIEHSNFNLLNSASTFLKLYFAAFSIKLSALDWHPVLCS